MVLLGNLLKHKDMFDELKGTEKQLIKIYKELPGDWFLRKEIVKLIEDAEKSIKENEEKIKDSPFGRIEKHLNSHYEKVIRNIERHLFFVEKELEKAKEGKAEPGMTKQLKDSMAVLIDSLHKLIFYSNLYPINKIKERKVWKAILAGLRSGIYLPPDISQETAVEMIKKFIGAELILAVRYNSNESPYLMITLNHKQLEMHIIKKDELRDSIIISRLMKLLRIRRMIIDYKHRLIDDSVSHINKIKYMKGVKVVGVGRLKNKKEILSFSFLLGATCADGFVLNLSDRPMNVYIDYDRFKKFYKHNPEKYLGEKNLMFHIDYGFLKSKNAEDYLKNQLFGSYGVFVHFFVDNIDLVKAKLTKKEVTESFNRGYEEELRRIEKNYKRNKHEINDTLSKNGLGYLARRFSTDSYKQIIEFENETLPQLDVPEYKAA